MNINVQRDREPLLRELGRWKSATWSAAPVIDGKVRDDGETAEVTAPHNRGDRVGQVTWTSEAHAREALEVASRGFVHWNERPAAERAACLERYADLMEQHMEELMAICCREAGKTLQDGIDEVREAVDFCRYYAIQGRSRFSSAITLPGPTGESNELYLEGRGVFLCISPWN